MAESEYSLEKTLETVLENMIDVEFQPGSNNKVMITYKDNIATTARLTREGVKESKPKRLFDSFDRPNLVFFSKDLEHVLALEMGWRQYQAVLGKRVKMSWGKRLINKFWRPFERASYIHELNHEGYTGTAIRNDGKYAALGCNLGLIVYSKEESTFYRLRRGEDIEKSKHYFKNDPELNEKVSATSFSWDGNYLCAAVQAADGRKEIRIYEFGEKIKELEELRVYVDHNVSAIAFSSDGKHLITSTETDEKEKNCLKVYRIGKEGLIETHNVESNSYRKMSVSKDNTRLIALRGNTLELYNINMR
jgi:WD40 repeat protein